jgi:hypothetical protein
MCAGTTQICSLRTKTTEARACKVMAMLGKRALVKGGVDGLLLLLRVRPISVSYLGKKNDNLVKSLSCFFGPSMQMQKQYFKLQLN